MLCRFIMYRAGSTFLALLCGLLFGCYQPAQDQPVTTGGEVAQPEFTTPVESPVSEAEDTAIAEILALVENEDQHGKVLTRNSGGHVVRVNLSSVSTANDDTLAHLQALPELEELFVALPEISDEGLKHLIGLKRLWRLDLEGSAISDVGMETLLQLKSLRDIRVQRCGITDQALSSFAKMQNLTRIRAAQTSISDSGLEHLKGKMNLELLDFRECNLLSDLGIEHLKGLTNLRELKIWGSRITNTGLRASRRAVESARA